MKLKGPEYKEYWLMNTMLSDVLVFKAPRALTGTCEEQSPQGESPSLPLTETRRFEPDVPIENLVISELNPRKHRQQTAIERISQLIRNHGFDPACAIKAVEGDDGSYHVFAGGTRLLAAQMAELKTVPVYVYDELSRSDIWRLAYLDNEQADAHTQVSPVDIWLDYAKRIEEDGWTQEQIAQFLGVSQGLVSKRVRLSRMTVVHKPVMEGLLDEGHCQEMLGKYSTSNTLCDWLTPDRAVSEIIDKVLGPQRTRPSVKRVRAVTKRWQAMIQAAEQACKSLPTVAAQEQFVEQLAASEVRSELGIRQVLDQIVPPQDNSDAVSDPASKPSQSTGFELVIQQLHTGRELVNQVPEDFHLLLVDPFNLSWDGSKSACVNFSPPIVRQQDLKIAFDLFEQQLKAAFHRMTDDATCLTFTDWELEPELRQVIRGAGFRINGSLVWHGPTAPNRNVCPTHQRIIYAVKGNPKPSLNPAAVLSSADSDESHNEKPLDVLKTLIEATTTAGQVVVNGNPGGCNTLVATSELGRRYFGCGRSSDETAKTLTNGWA